MTTNWTTNQGNASKYFLMSTKSQIAELYSELENVKFISPNEPLTKYDVERVVREME